MVSDCRLTRQLGPELSDHQILVNCICAGKLKPAEVKGSTFTLSNLGMFGIEQFTVILNPPEVGILTGGAVQETPVGLNGQLVLQPMMRVTRCTDHRAVDGAAAFLKTIRQMLENPSPAIPQAATG